MRANAPLIAMLTALVLSGCGGGSTGSSSGATTQVPLTPPAPSSAPQIWIQPKPESQGQTGILGGGSSDFTSLFSGTASWPSTAARTNVFGLYAGWVADIDTATLTTVVDFLTAHRIPIELEAPSLQATAACGSGVEGYVPNGQSLATFTNAYLGRLKALGADVRYIKVDEPFFFGSDALSSPNSCAWPVAVVAQAVAQYVRLVHATYPNADVGDVEPVITTGYGTDPVTAIAAWHDAFAQAMGASFPFFVADMDFSNPGWPALAVQMQTMIRARAEQFGIIFIGDLSDTTDAAWSSTTLARAQTFAATSGNAPDFVFFQSWQPYPQFCLPETDPTTFTGVVDAYLTARDRAAGAVGRDQSRADVGSGSSAAIPRANKIAAVSSM